MDRTGIFKRRTNRHRIDETAARLARRKRALASRGSRLGQTLYSRLTSPRAFIIAGSAGYLIGELSRSNACTDQLPDRSRPPGALFNDASLWLRTTLALAKWAHAALDAPVDTGPSDGLDVPHHAPPCHLT